MGKNGVETILDLLKEIEKNIETETEKIQTAQGNIQTLSRSIASLVSIYLDLEKVPRKKIFVVPGDKPPCVHDPSEWEETAPAEPEEKECYIVCWPNYLPKDWETSPVVIFQNGRIIFKFEEEVCAVIPDAWHNGIGIFQSPAGVIQYICENKVLLTQFYKEKK